uniref:Putative ficolin n=1 Tax=Psorophora albipes TaxID=869069 RepID=T1E277_9DIPT
MFKVINFIFYILLFASSIASSVQVDQASCNSFGYELVAARLDALENAVLKSQLKSAESVQNVRTDIHELTRNVQNLIWGYQAGAIGGGHAGFNPVLPKSCQDVQSKKSGTHLIDVSHGVRKPFEVYCDQDFEGGGWIVFQNRYNGAVDFYRSWSEYKEGFGTLDGEFWLGLDKLHEITYSGSYELAVLIEDYSGQKAFAKYSQFAIGGEAEFYSLNKLGTYSGTAEDSFSYHLNGKFSTFDRDNDEHETHCAAVYIGAWWYRACHMSNLNSRYREQGEANKIIVWRKWKGDSHALKKTRMMIRRTVE